MLGLDLLKRGPLPSVLVVNQVLENKDLVLRDLIQRNLSQVLDDLAHVFEALIGSHFELLCQFLKLYDHLGQLETMILAVCQALLESV